MTDLDADRVFARVAKAMLGEDVDAPRVGHYELRDKLGAGAMGEVYSAWDPQAEREVAVKVVRPDDAAASRRLEREARALERLDHPNVVRILDVGRVGERVFIAMERLRGETLQARLEREGRLPPETTQSIVGQICAAIAQAHALGIVHRDLKPANVFLTENAVKVLDFGIAKGLGSGTLGASTASGTLLGTPHYMSPEQATDAKRIDHRTDLWAVGVIAYECLVGARPFEGKNVAELAVAIVTTDPPKVSPPLDAWFARALARDPAARFQSADELANAFAETLARRSFSLRLPIAIVIVAITVVVLWWVGAFTSAAPVAPMIPDPPDVEEPPPVRSEAPPPPQPAEPAPTPKPRKAAKRRADVDDLEF